MTELSHKRIRYHYDVIKQRRFYPDLGFYFTYGIIVTWSGKHPYTHYRKLDDVSHKLCTVWKMADRFNRVNLPAIHLKDVVENLI